MQFSVIMSEILQHQLG